MARRRAPSNYFDCEKAITDPAMRNQAWIWKGETNDQPVTSQAYKKAAALEPIF